MFQPIRRCAFDLQIAVRRIGFIFLCLVSAYAALPAVNAARADEAPATDPSAEAIDAATSPNPGGQSAAGANIPGAAAAGAAGNVPEANISEVAAVGARAATLLSASNGSAPAQPSSVQSVPQRRSMAERGMLPVADNIVIRKGARRMELMKGSEILRTYHIALGLRPSGYKEQEGDFRTPEGKYRIVRRNARSDYFLSLQISYPNDADIARSKKLRVAPGGAIMIHGTPNVPRKPLDYYRSVDWTDGCVAVANSDMVEVWLMTSNDTPVEILP